MLLIIPTFPFFPPLSPWQRSVDASCELTGHRCPLSSQHSHGMTCYCIAELYGIQAFTLFLSDKVENFLRAWIITNISVLCILYFAKCEEYNRYLSTELNSYPTIFSFVIKRNISYCCSLRINPSEGMCWFLQTWNKRPCYRSPETSSHGMSLESPSLPLFHLSSLREKHMKYKFLKAINPGMLRSRRKKVRMGV